MTLSITRLDPQLPVCWEDLDTLRIGFDQVLARVRAPGPAAHRLITALRSGLSDAQLESLLITAGPDQDQLREILEGLAPALSTLPCGVGAAPADPGSGCGSGTNAKAGASGTRAPLDVGFAPGRRSAAQLKAALGLIDCIALRGSPRNRATGPPQLVIQVERYAEPADGSHRWLMAGIPHLLVRFSDRTASVGPLIGADGRPCHQCLCLRRVEAEPALPVVAAQLIGSRAASESGRICRILTVLIERTIESWIAGDPSVHRTIRVLPVEGERAAGPPRSERVEPHPQCACAEPALLAVPTEAAPHTGRAMRSPVATR